MKQSQFIDLNKFFKNLYYINQKWFDIRLLPAREDQIDRLMELVNKCNIDEISQLLNEIESGKSSRLH